MKQRYTVQRTYSRLSANSVRTPSTSEVGVAITCSDRLSVRCIFYVLSLYISICRCSSTVTTNKIIVKKLRKIRSFLINVECPMTNVFVYYDLR